MQKDVTLQQDFTSRQHTTLVDILRWRAYHQPDRLAYTFLSDGETIGARLTYEQLDQQARCIAAHLQQRDVVGERVLLLYPPSLDYIAAFFGCLYAGVIAVPAYPPASNRSLARIEAIVTDAQAIIALTTQSILSKVKNNTFHSDLQKLQWIATDNLPSDAASQWQEVYPKSDVLTFLQYTSGSTGLPKGVMVSHENLMHNSAMMCKRWEHTADSVGVFWLPIFHDMGLIAGVLQPLYVGYQAILMAPASFLQRPIRWLQAISTFGGTTSCAPNFAFELCARRVTPEELQRLDLGKWTIAVNGAEPVQAETIERFTRTFSSCGLRLSTITPGYGLAEGTLMVSSTEKDAQPTLFTCDKTQLEQHHVVPVPADDPLSQTLVGCGTSSADQRVVIVQPETRRICRYDEVGEIWVAGPSVARGYWQRPAETAETFHALVANTGEGPFLRTGDLGFLYNGELFVTGRLKDVIIIRGRNHYPQDIELTTERSHPALRPGCGAAFSCEIDNEERLVIVQEMRRDYKETPEIYKAIRQAIAEEHEIQVYAIVLVRQGSIFKTSSGKIQRRACKTAFLKGELQAIGQNILAEDGSEELSKQEVVEDYLTREELLTMDKEKSLQRLTAYLYQQITLVLKKHLHPISYDTNLYTLGLDSLMVAELKYRIDTSLNVDIPFLDIVENPTISHMAALILAEITGENSINVSFPRIIRSLEQRTTFPLSFAQEQLWFLQQLEPASTFYTIPVAIELQGKLSIHALAKSIDTLVQRHEMLRTTFTEVDGSPVQSIQQHTTFSFPLITLETILPSHKREKHAQHIMQQAARQPFDLATQKPIRVILLRLTSEEHLLFLMFHHIAADGWSIHILINELIMAYKALFAQQPLSLPALPIRYGDYVLHHRQWIESHMRETHLTYWKTQLQQLSPLELPTNHPRPAIQRYQGATHHFLLPPKLQQQVKDFSSSEGVTIFMTLLAAFQILLFRYSGQEDIAVGTDIAHRYRPETRDLVGFFVNTCVIRCDLSGSPSFRTLLQRVRAACLGAYAHQDLPFTLVVEALHPQRSLSRNPLFQVLFTLQQTQVSMAQTAELTLRPRAIATSAAKFDLSLDITDSEDGLMGIVEYNTDLFEANTITRLTQHFETLLENSIIDPDQPVAQIPIFTQEQRHRLLTELNNTSRDYPIYRTFQHLFKEQANRTPSALAIICGQERLTYRELDRRANQLAQHLQTLGVGSETLVGLYMERSVEMLVAILATWKAGGAYLPLDPTYPSQHLAYMLENAQIQVVVTQSALQAALPMNIPTLVCLDPGWHTIIECSEETPVALDNKDQLAYVIYTSGSTGRPKGVMISQQGMLNHIFAKIETLQLTEYDRVAQNASASFDIAVWQMLAVLLCGGQVRMLADQIAHDPQELFAQAANENITVLEVVPSLLRAFLDSSDQCGRYPNLHLRWLVVTGEAFASDLCLRWLQHYPHIPLVNAYGPTECSDDVTHAVIHSAYQQNRPGVPIGYPIANTQIYLLDHNLEPVPPGVPGDIYVGGSGVGRGYLHDAERTAASFLPNPFNVQAGARLYKTGDMGKYLVDGQIEFQGRRDQQVKVRGYRIEPGEIEAVLKRHPAVRDCAVVVWDNASHNKRLVAYMLKQQTSIPPHTELRDYLREHLPEYMHPSLFFFLDAFPLTRNGKLDRKVLSTPSDAPDVENEHYEAPRTELEELLAVIWARALDLPRVSINDNFFELGGHSLLATQLISRIRTQLHVELPLRSIFDAPTIASLAAQITHKTRHEHMTDDGPIPSVPRDRPLPLSFAQQRLWFFYQLIPEDTSYNVIRPIHFHGMLNGRILEQCLHTIVQRHEILRTTFTDHGHQVMQIIGPAIVPPLRVVNLQAIDEAVWNTTMLHLINDLAHQPFDLNSGPVFRYLLLQRTATHHVLVFIVHHIAFDAWSEGIFTREIAALYMTFIEGRACSLPELPIQYGDFAIWQRQWLQGERLTRLLAYWKKQLRGATPLDLPTDYPRQDHQNSQGAVELFALPPALSTTISRFCRQQNVTLFTVLVAAFQVFLYRLTHQTDIVIGTPIANRTRTETEELIGFFVNTLILRTQLGGKPHFLEVLRDVNAMLLDTHAHQELPFEQLVEALQIERTGEQVPLIRVLFAFQNTPAQYFEVQGLAIRPVEIEVKTTHFDLAFYLWEDTGSLVGGINYRTSLFHKTTITVMAQRFITLLHSIIAQPETRIDALDISLEEEKARQRSDTLVEQNTQRLKLKVARRHEISLAEE
jgi:amino acid adenylation domain-containing protein